MKKFLRVGAVGALVLVVAACATGPKIDSPEQPEIGWQIERSYEYVVAAGDDAVIVVPRLTLRGPEAPGAVVNVTDGSEIEQLSDEETLQISMDILQEQHGFSFSIAIPNKFAPREWIFPDRGITVSVGEQRFGLIRNNVSEPEDDIRVTDSASGAVLRTITRNGLLWDVAIADDAIYLLTSAGQQDDGGDARRFTVRKNDVETGAELFAASTEVMPAFNHYGFTVAGLTVVGDRVVVSSEGVSGVDANRGTEVWHVENSPVSGVGRAMGGLGFSGRVDPAPLVFEDSVILHDIDGVFRRVNVSDGRVIWESDKVGWHDYVALSPDGQHMYTTLGLAGMKPPTDKRDAKYQFQGRPGIVSIDLATGGQMWETRLDDPALGIVAFDSSVTVFSEGDVLSVTASDGVANVRANIKDDWGIRTIPIACDLERFPGEALLTFEDRVVWATTDDGERTGEVPFGMSAVTPFAGLMGLSYRLVNNSLLVDIVKDQMVYLYVIDTASRNLRYYHSIVSREGYGRYDHLGMYVLSTNKRGNQGAVPGTVLTGYLVP